MAWMDRKLQDAISPNSFKGCSYRGIELDFLLKLNSHFIQFIVDGGLQRAQKSYVTTASHFITRFALMVILMNEQAWFVNQIYIQFAWFYDVFWLHFSS